MHFRNLAYIYFPFSSLITSLGFLALLARSCWSSSPHSGTGFSRARSTRASSSLSATHRVAWPLR